MYLIFVRSGKNRYFCPWSRGKKIQFEVYNGSVDLNNSKEIRSVKWSWDRSLKWDNWESLKS